jgi:hypothetical protein
MIARIEHSRRQHSRWAAAWQMAGWLLIAVAQGIAGGSYAAEPPKRYELERSGFLQLKVPAGWREEIDTGVQPPAISFKPQTGQPFIVTVIPAQAPQGKRAPSNQQLRADVEQMAEAIRHFSVEGDKIKLKHIGGAAGQGFQFFATDAAPAAGEFKYMTRGRLKVGNDVAMTFTILTNDGQESVIRAAQAMLKSATRVAK